MSNASSSSANKLIGLELLRFLAAFAVLIWHYHYFTYVGYEPVDFQPKNQPLFGQLSFLYRFGYYGVNVFWCISGFIFFWKYSKLICEHGLGAVKFGWLRFSRLYPLHLLTLLLMAILQLGYLARHRVYFSFQYNDIFHFVLQLFMASSWGFEKGPSFNAPIWSVSVEIIAYIVFFFGLRWGRRPIALICCVLLVCAAAKGLRIYSPIFDCLTFFFVGGAAALAKQRIAKRFNVKAVRQSVLIVTACLIAFPILAIVLKAYEWHAFPIVALLLYCPLLIYVLSADLRLGDRFRRVLEVAGNMTYASYLIHFPIMLAAILLCEAFRVAIPFHSGLFLMAFLGGTLLLSRWTFKAFESPMQNWIRGWANARSRRRLADDVRVEAP